MAIAFDRKLGEGTGTSATNPLLIVTTAATEFVVIWMACDNTAGTSLPNVTDVQLDGVSQTYNLIVAHGSASTSAGGATRGFIILVPAIDAATSKTL